VEEDAGKQTACGKPGVGAPAGGEAGGGAGEGHNRRRRAAAQVDRKGITGKETSRRSERRTGIVWWDRTSGFVSCVRWFCLCPLSIGSGGSGGCGAALCDLTFWRLVPTDRLCH
jgi:hypothetical protein